MLVDGRAARYRPGVPKLGAVTQDLEAIAALDDDLQRRPSDLGLTPTALDPGDPAGPLAPAGRQVVALEPLVLALPLTRTLAIAAAASELIELALPWETPAALQDLLAERSGLTLDQATSVVDLTLELLAGQLGVTPSRDAGLAEDSTALAQLDTALAAAADRDAARLLRAADVVASTFEELGTADAVASALADLGLGETALAIRAADA